MACRCAWWAARATWTGFGIHTLGLVTRYIEAGYTPVTSLHEAMSFFAWSIVGLYLLLQCRNAILIRLLFRAEGHGNQS